MSLSCRSMLPAAPASLVPPASLVTPAATLLNHARLVLVAFAMAVAFLGAAQAQSRFSSEEREEVVRILREALVRDPSILRDAIGALQNAEAKAEEEASRIALAEQGSKLGRDPGDPSTGPGSATVTVVEFFDYRCPYCRQMVPRTAELLRSDKDVRLVWKDLPILGPNSVVLSRAALAAHAQGRYAEMHEALFAMRGNPDEAALRAAARAAKVDYDRMRVDMEGPEVSARIEANLAQARALGIRGTPAYVIEGRLLGGAVPIESLQQAVADARTQPRQP